VFDPTLVNLHGKIVARLVVSTAETYHLFKSHQETIWRVFVAHSGLWSAKTQDKVRGINKEKRYKHRQKTKTKKMQKKAKTHSHGHRHKTQIQQDETEEEARREGEEEGE
jgi:hypothetical protein